MTQVTPGSPPDLSFDGSTTADPAIYCGLDTTQSVISGTTQPEFNYPSGSGDNTVHGTTSEDGIPINNPIDKLALSLDQKLIDRLSGAFRVAHVEYVQRSKPRGQVEGKGIVHSDRNHAALESGILQRGIYLRPHPVARCGVLRQDDQHPVALDALQLLLG